MPWSSVQFVIPFFSSLLLLLLAFSMLAQERSRAKGFIQIEFKWSYFIRGLSIRRPVEIIIICALRDARFGIFFRMPRVERNMADGQTVRE